MSLQHLRRSVLARRWFAALALLAMALKAAIPAGFMVAAVDGHVQLVVCPAGIHRPAGPVSSDGAIAMQGVAMPGMEMAHATHAGSHVAADCPFALASTAGLAPASLALPKHDFELLVHEEPAVVVSIPRAPPPRHQAPRGPPSPA